MGETLHFEQARKRVEELIPLLDQHSHDYYVLDQPSYPR